jgi:hypothetical protein
MTNLAGRCHQIALHLKRRAMWVGFFVTFLLAVTVAALVLLPGPRPFSAALLALLTLTSAFATLALSALLWFDAALFALMSTYPDETAAGRAVDDFLARAKLKPLPDATRPLSDRIAGARRLVRRQLMLAAGTAFFAVLAFAANFA